MLERDKAQQEEDAAWGPAKRNAPRNPTAYAEAMKHVNGVLTRLWGAWDTIAFTRKKLGDLRSPSELRRRLEIALRYESWWRKEEQVG